MFIFPTVLESKFKQGRMASNPGQLFTVTTKGQGPRSMTLPEGQSKYFIILGRLTFLDFFSIQPKVAL
jgi:hypothetical protein